MSTNVLQIPKTKGAIILFSGMYLFFVSLLISPFITFPLFSSPEVTTKLFLATSAAIIALLQLLFYVPRISRAFVTALPKFVKPILSAMLTLGILSVLFANSPGTALFGMYSMWEHNIALYVVYSVLLIAWYVYFHLLTHLKLQGLIFHSLMTLLIVTLIVYGIGSYYLWDIDNEYISNSVARLSLSFRNPLLAAYFIGMLANYQFARTLSILLQKHEKKTDVFTSVLQLLLYIGIVYMLIITFTRSAWIAFGVVALVTVGIAVWFFAKQKELSQNIGKLAVACGLLVIAIFPFVYLHGDDISKRNSDFLIESKNTLGAIADSVGNSENTEKALADFYQQSQDYSSAEIRILEWKWGLRTLVASPRNALVGVGADNAYFEMPKFRSAEFNNIPIDSGVKPFYVRNIVVTFLVEHGILSTLLAVLAIAWVLLTLMQSISRLEQPLGNKLTLLAPISLLLGFFAQGMFYYSTVLPTVLFIFGLSFTLTQVTDFGKISLRKPTGTEKILLISIAIALGIWLGLILKAERILSFYKVSPLPPSQEIVEKNAVLPLNNNILKRYLVYIYPGNKVSKEYMKKMMNSTDPDDLRITSDALYKLAKENLDPQALLDSIATTEKLLAITPTYPVPWDERGLRYLYLGDFEKARASFVKAIELKEDYWYAYMHLGEVSRQQCKPTEALEWYAKAERYIPSAQVEITETKAEIEHPREECLTTPAN